MPGGHKGHHKHVTPKEVKAYKALRDDHFTEAHEKMQAPKGGIFLDPYATLQCNGELTQKRRLEADQPLEPGANLLKKYRNLRQETISGIKNVAERIHPTS